MLLYTAASTISTIDFVPLLHCDDLVHPEFLVSAFMFGQDVSFVRFDVSEMSHRKMLVERATSSCATRGTVFNSANTQNTYIRETLYRYGLDKTINMLGMVCDSAHHPNHFKYLLQYHLHRMLVNRMMLFCQNISQISSVR